MKQVTKNAKKYCLRLEIHIIFSLETPKCLLSMKPIAPIEVGSLIKMMQAEKRAQYRKYKLDTEGSLSRICDSGDALGPLLLTKKLATSRWVLSGKSFYSRFRSGDRVEIHVQRENADSSIKLLDGWLVEQVYYPQPGTIEVVISGGKLAEINKNQEVFLFQSSGAIYRDHMENRLRALTQEDDPIILGDDSYRLNIDDNNFRRVYEQLNKKQQEALHILIGNNFNGAVQGPPGTGKTQLLRSVVSLAVNSGLKVGVAAFTNAAVDNILSRVVGEAFENSWIRVASPGRVRQDLYHPDLQKTSFVAEGFYGNALSAGLIGTTLHKLVFSKKTPQFDLLVIDEAGQVPVYFWPFIQRMTKRLILVGDQFQLPPVLSGGKKHLCHDNIFSFFVNSETPMLETQYRMRREIQEWSSNRFYKGKLKPHVSVSNRDYYAHSPAFVADSFIAQRQFLSSSSNTSRAEANFIADKIQRLTVFKEDLGSVGVICPYRSQAGVVNAALQSKLGVEAASRVLVDTVERFQGQEKEAIFISFGGSGRTEDDLRFLSDPRRLNVAVTRARSRLYCLFDQSLLQNSKNVATKDLHEFLNWVTYGKLPAKRAA